MGRTVIVGVTCASVLMPVTVAAQSVHGVNCGLWMEARADRSPAYENYLTGFLDGVSTAKRVDFWRMRKSDEITQDQVHLWMDNYCQDNPLSFVIPGAMTLFIQRTGEK